MTTQKLPGTDAARHGTGDADLTTLTAAEWRGVGRKIASKNGLAAGSEMFAWALDGADREHAAATLGQLPPPLRLLYRARWKPRFERTPRW